MFEAMDGRQLLNCLTAARFGAVEWKVVEGTGHEKAVFREVDTSTPEYQAFEKQLYTKALERMGFQDMLAPDQVAVIENNVTELKLYSPLCAELEGEAPARDWIDEPDPPEPPPLTGEDLSAPALRAAVLKGIEDEQAPEESGRGLMIYFDGSEAVNEKVISFFPSVEEVDGCLYGVAVCQVKGELTPPIRILAKAIFFQLHHLTWAEFTFANMRMGGVRAFPSGPAIRSTATCTSASIRTTAHTS